MSARRPLAPATRLGITALVLLLLAACVLSIYTYDQLRDMRAASDRTRSQLMAQSLSLRISHAVESGIPLRGLVGVEALFQQRMASQPDIHAVALVLPDGKVLWEVTRDAAAAGATAEEAAPAPAKPALNARKLFATNCSWCHQDYGMKAADGPKLAGTSLTEAEVIDRITRGKTPMPGFRKIMTAEQIEALAKYIKGLKDPGN